MKKYLINPKQIKFLKALKLGAYLLCLTTLLFSCSNDKQEPVRPPSAALQFGYLVNINGETADYTPQNEIYQKQLDSKLIIGVEEHNIDLEPLHENEYVLSKPFAFEITTLKDREVFVTNNQDVYVLGGGYGIWNGQSKLEFKVAIPVKITTEIIPNNGVLEVSTQNDFINVLYTSAQSGLQVSKEMVIKK